MDESDDIAAGFRQLKPFSILPKNLIIRHTAHLIDEKIPVDAIETGIRIAQNIPVHQIEKIARHFLVGAANQNVVYFLFSESDGQRRSHFDAFAHFHADHRILRLPALLPAKHIQQIYSPASLKRPLFARCLRKFPRDSLQIFSPFIRIAISCPEFPVFTLRILLVYDGSTDGSLHHPHRFDIIVFEQEPCVVLIAL